MERERQVMKMMEIINILQRGENAMSREEIQRFFQQSGLLHGDETPVPKLGAGDMDVRLPKRHNIHCPPLLSRLWLLGCAILDAVQGANRSRSGATARICNAAMRQNSYIPAARGIDQRFPDIRNPVLASFAAKILPYRSLGSGLLRALRAWPKIELIDDREGNLFKVIVTREHGV